MKYGVIYPQTEYGNDPLAIRDFAQVAEELGYSHILAYEHVLGANPGRPGGFKGTYTYQSPFQDPFVLFSYMAGFTHKIGLTTGVLVLPQRQTPVVAKQAASLDLLCRGRLRLGVGVGWNKIEFEALNKNFHNRGRRIEEQIEVLRLLWSQPLVTFSGRFHELDDVGLNPLPLQRPIPIWIGGNATPVLRRAAEMSDGWMPNFRSIEATKPAMEKLKKFLHEANRSPDKFGVEARILYGDGNPASWATDVQEWGSVGATHISLNTMKAGLESPQEHLDAIRRFAEEMGI